MEGIRLVSRQGGGETFILDGYGENGYFLITERQKPDDSACEILTIEFKKGQIGDAQFMSARDRGHNEIRRRLMPLQEKIHNHVRVQVQAHRQDKSRPFQMRSERETGRFPEKTDRNGTHRGPSARVLFRGSP